MARLPSQLLQVVCLLWSLVIGSVLASDLISVPDRQKDYTTAVQTAESTSDPQSVYEHILSFDAHARFNSDGRMVMRENIKVQALGQQIRRGIFRTLPLRWDRQDGKMFNVDYQIIQVLRNGVPEPYSVEKSGKTLTVRIGSAEQLLQPGVYDYEIQYQVSNHFSRFPEWDELYWNVTGNDWAYPIDSASFHLELPEARYYLDNRKRDGRLGTIDIYTGAFGEKQHNARILPDGSVVTSQPLAQGEGLTVAYTWPRTVLANAPDPQASSPLVHLLLPTAKTAALWIPVLLLLGYCLFWWRKNVTEPGLKMPAIVPLFELPAALSPGYLRFITQRSYDDIAFSSDLLSLVAKRGVALSQKEGKSSGWGFFKRLAKPEQWLSLLPSAGNTQLNDNDKQLLKTLFANDRKNINLSVAYQRPMQNARIWLEKCCTKQEPQLFTRLGKAVRRAVYILLLIPLICGLLFNPGVAIVTAFALLILLLGLTLLSLPLMMLFRPSSVISDTKGRVLFFIFFTLFGLGVISFGAGMMFVMLDATQYPAGYIGALLASILLCLIFLWCIPRYTQQGLNDLAIAKGLKLYLGAAEKYRYQSLYPPDQLVSHFERLLPVALALGVGKTWANTFAQYLITTGAMSEVFTPTDWDRLHNFNRDCRSSSSPTPSRSNSSSSSGSSPSGSGSSGGGSSGGGSGGGGGGGW
ncbi:DUF2207 domain-containing protein [Serratia sp. S1B]|nr:DUF2207 domain-containing protein [Serratia sp. S1B]